VFQAAVSTVCVYCGCRQLFYELRVAVEVMCSKPQCPQCVFAVVVGSCSMSCVWPWR